MVAELSCRRQLFRDAPTIGDEACKELPLSAVRKNLRRLSKQSLNKRLFPLRYPYPLHIGCHVKYYNVGITFQTNKLPLGGY